MSKTLRTLQENLTIALSRRPTFGSSVKGTGISEQHFPRDLRPAYGISMTKSQDEIRRLVLAEDPRIWPLYGKRIIEWTEKIAEASRRDEDQVLQALAGDPRASLAAMAMKYGWKMRDGAPNRSKVQRILRNLQRDKLIKQQRKGGDYEITEKGEKVLKQRGTD
jgi:hypothetical protein